MAQCPNRPQQSGSVLIIALVFLLAMTLIGTIAMQGTTQQERMAGNFWDRNLAFQAAEAALATGGRAITAGATIPLPSNNPPQVENNDTEWWNNNSNSTAVTIAGVKSSPRYITQSLGASKEGGFEFGVITSFMCRVVSRSTGGSGNAIVILEEVRECG